MACKWINCCPLRFYEKDGSLSLKWKKAFCLADFEKCERYKSAAKGTSLPDYVMPDGSVNENIKMGN